MRHLPIIFASAALSLGLLAGFGRAEAMPALSLDASASKASPVQEAGYYRRWRGYRPYYGYYGYGYRPYGYYGYGYRPWGYYGYGRPYGWRY
jgi:hypothetical protein